MTNPHPEFCAAFYAIDEAHRNMRPLPAENIARIIEQFPETKTEFEEISKELRFGAVVTDEQIAERVRMPLAFIRSLILALRDGNADAFERPAGATVN